MRAYPIYDLVHVPSWSRGRIVAANRAAEQMLGWTEAELLGRDLRQAVYARPQEGNVFKVELAKRAIVRGLQAVPR